MEFVSFIFSILIYFNIIICIVGWIWAFIIWLRCHKIKECHSKTCRHRFYCSRRPLTIEDRIELREMYLSYRKQS